MISADLANRLKQATNELRVAFTSWNTQAIRNRSDVQNLFSEAKLLAQTWLARAEPVLANLDDESVQPLIQFQEAIARIANEQLIGSGVSIPDALRTAIHAFKVTLPVLVYSLLEASGMTGVSSEDFPKKREAALYEISVASERASLEISRTASGKIEALHSAASEANSKIEKTVEDAQKDLERVKTQASRISVESAREQFNNAARSLRVKAWFWGITAAIFFLTLLSLLFFLLEHPPTLIRQITDAVTPGSKPVALPVTVPLLITASAYFTSIRLATIGILGIGLAFSLRITRAYLHMIEHNQHKLRVTNSIEAFVAAVRTPEQKDLVLSKLVESVTEFGESGILGKQGEGSNLPSVIFESMTKNVGKSD